MNDYFQFDEYIRSYPPTFLSAKAKGASAFFPFF